MGTLEGGSVCVKYVKSPKEILFQNSNSPTYQNEVNRKYRVEFKTKEGKGYVIGSIEKSQRVKREKVMNNKILIQENVPNKNIDCM